MRRQEHMVGQRSPSTIYEKIQTHDFYMTKGSSINDVTAYGGRGYQGFCDGSTRALLVKCVTIGGGGVKNCAKLLDIIYGRPLTVIPDFHYILFDHIFLS